MPLKHREHSRTALPNAEMVHTDLLWTGVRRRNLKVCAELHERFEAFCRRSLYDINLVVLFLDAIYLPVRPGGPKEGVICA